MAAQRPPRARARDEDVDLDAGRLRGPGVGHAQVAVDRPLVPNPARHGAGGAHGVEDGRRRLGPEGGGDHAAPSGRVDFLAGLEFGGLELGEAPGDGLDGNEGVALQEGGQDVAAHGAGAAEDECCGHVLGGVENR